MTIFPFSNACDWPTVGNFNGTRFTLGDMVRQPD